MLEVPVKWSCSLYGYKEKSRFSTHLSFCCRHAQDCFILHMEVASDGLGAMLEHNIQLAVTVLTGEEKTL